MGDLFITEEFMRLRLERDRAADRGRRETRRRWLLTLAAFFAGCVVSLFGGFPKDPVLGHVYADQVLYPRLMAAFNEYALLHPGDRPGAERKCEHCLRLDKGDRERFQALADLFDEWRAAMKTAGY